MKNHLHERKEVRTQQIPSYSRQNGVMPWIHQSMVSGVLGNATELSLPGQKQMIVSGRRGDMSQRQGEGRLEKDWKIRSRLLAPLEDCWTVCQMLCWRELPNSNQVVENRVERREIQGSVGYSTTSTEGGYERAKWNVMPHGKATLIIGSRCLHGHHLQRS